MNIDEIFKSQIGIKHDQAEENIKQAIKQLMLEVIGEDEEPEKVEITEQVDGEKTRKVMVEKMFARMECYPKNRLRQEQRERLEEYFK